MMIMVDVGKTVMIATLYTVTPKEMCITMMEPWRKSIIPVVTLDHPILYMVNTKIYHITIHTMIMVITNKVEIGMLFTVTKGETSISMMEQ